MKYFKILQIWYGKLQEFVYRDGRFSQFVKATFTVLSVIARSRHLY